MDRSIFISYSHNDRGAVRRDADLLRASGVRVFIDVTDIAFGERWRDVLQQALLQCERMLVFWSRSALASEWVDREWRCALSLGKKIVPTLLDTTPLPAELAEFQAVKRYRRAPRQPPQPTAAPSVFGAAPAPVDVPAARPPPFSAPAPSMAAGAPAPRTAARDDLKLARPRQAPRGGQPLVTAGAAAVVLIAAGAGGWWLLAPQGAPPASHSPVPSPAPPPVAASPAPSTGPAPSSVPAPPPPAPSTAEAEVGWVPPLVLMLVLAAAVWAASRRWRRQTASRPAAEPTAAKVQPAPVVVAPPAFEHTDIGMPFDPSRGPLGDPFQEPDAPFEAVSDRDFVRAVFAA